MHGGQISRTAIALLAAVSLASCAMNDEPREKLSEGLERARGHVEEVLEAVAPDLTTIPDRGTDPVECNNALGMGTGTFNDDYGVKIKIPDQDSAQRLFEETISYWENQGYEVSLENAERGQPIDDDSVVAVQLGDGYFGALELFPSRKSAYLGISTPCLAP